MVIDPIRDRASGQQTGVSVRLESDLAPALAAVKGITLLPFDSTGASKARYVVTGIVAAREEPDHYTLTVALSDRQSGLVVAQSAARFVEAGLDRKPTRFFVESPVLVQDRSSEGYTRTTETPAGRAADALYISQMETSALLATRWPRTTRRNGRTRWPATRLPPSARTGNSSGRSTALSHQCSPREHGRRGQAFGRSSSSGSRRTTLP